MIAGTRPADSHAGDVRKCPRCGIERQARKTTALCSDCRYTLSDEELPRWVA